MDAQQDPAPIRVPTNGSIGTVLLWFLVFTALALRLYGLPHGLSFHPDERHIIGVTLKLGPKDWNPHFFAYGSFPFYLLYAVSRIAAFWDQFYVGYDGLFWVGRALAGLFGAGAVYLTYLLAQRVYCQREISLTAAALLAFNIFHIQLSHFYAFDIVLVVLNLAALVFMVRIPAGGAWRSYLGSAVFIGISIGTKISSLSLFVPLLAAAMLETYNRRRWLDWGVVSKLFVAVVVALLAFFAVEPYAFFDFRTFYANNREQIEMVNGIRRLPYTIQYENTVPFLYHLKQMLLWTMGPPVALAAFAGCVTMVVQQTKRLGQREAILIAFLVPVFVTVAPQFVKFPRYLIPIYPVMLIAAAALLSDLRKRLRSRGRAIACVPHAIAIGWAVWSALAFKTIHAVPHAYFQASEWIFENIPAGSKLVQGHWDDTLPLHLPGDRSPERYRIPGEREFYLSLDAYEPDSPAKRYQMASVLSRGDYVVFPTNRLYGSLLRVPDEFSDTDRMFRLLFSGELGYRVVHTFKTRPRLGPLVLNDDMLDESLSVYDHPKVVILQNLERLGAVEIARRIETGEAKGLLLTFEQIMKLDLEAPPTAEEASAGPGVATRLSPILWPVMLEALSFAVFPIVALAMRRSADLGLGASKVFGFVLPGFLVWMGTALGLFETNRTSIVLVTVALFAVSHLIALGSFGGWRKLFARLGDNLVYVESLTLGVYLFFMVVQAFHPEIFWGEKPMDFTFLNYFVRLETLPPEDPWASGQRMHYYYLGTYLCAVLHKLSGITTPYGYNLAIAWLPAMLVAACYTVLVSVTRNRALSAAGALAVTMLSDPEVLKLWLVDGKRLNFDLFWASTRLFVSPGISEYPFWSFLFADLHAHVIAIPITVAVVALGIELLRVSHDLFSANLNMARLLFALLLAVLLGVNTWDYLTYAAFTALVLCYRPLPERDRSWSATGLSKRAGIVLLEGAAIAALSYVIAYPYTSASGAKGEVGWGWVYDNEFNDASMLLRLIGHWLLAVTVGALCAWSRRKRGAGAAWSLAGAAFAAAVPLVVAATAYYAGGVRNAPWGIISICSALTFLVTLACWRPGAPLSLRAAGAMATVALLVAAGAEQIFLIDRSNTLFKFYNAVWVLLGLATFALWPSIFALGSPLFGRLGRGSVMVAMATCALASAANVKVMTSFQRVEGPRPTLDGTAYLSTFNPEEARMVEWMRESIGGLPVLLEAQGEAYQNYNRIAMHTGLPVVVGWEHHISQRGTPRDEIDRRKADIATIYKTADISLAIQLIRKYDVKLIVVGKLERERYGQFGLDKFAARPDLFPLLFQSGTTALYTTSASLVASRPGANVSIAW